MSILGHDDETLPRWPPLTPPRSRQSPWWLIGGAIAGGAVGATMAFGPQIDALAPDAGVATLSFPADAGRSVFLVPSRRPHGTGLYPVSTVTHGCAEDAGAVQVFDFGVHLGEAFPGETCDDAIARLEAAERAR